MSKGVLLPEDYSIWVTIKYWTAWKQDFLLPEHEKPLSHNKTCLWVINLFLSWVLKIFTDLLIQILFVKAIEL